jgi:leucyl aminopeptidase (aminopeptidase T)
MDPQNNIGIDDGNATKYGSNFLAGQFSVIPKFGSINGKLVFTGSLIPACGILHERVVVEINGGKVCGIDGGIQAAEFKRWLASFDDPNMYMLAHWSFGLNPGAIYSGNVLEDERVWGSTEWGIGNVGPMLTSDIPGGIPAPSHTDGICMNSTVWLDGELFVENGEVVGPTPDVVELALIAKRLEY